MFVVILGFVMIDTISYRSIDMSNIERRNKSGTSSKDAIEYEWSLGSHSVKEND